MNIHKLISMITIKKFATNRKLVVFLAFVIFSLIMAVYLIQNFYVNQNIIIEDRAEGKYTHSKEAPPRESLLPRISR